MKSITQDHIFFENTISIYFNEACGFYLFHIDRGWTNIDKTATIHH